MGEEDQGCGDTTGIGCTVAPSLALLRDAGGGDSFCYALLELHRPQILDFFEREELGEDLIGSFCR